MDQLLPRDEPNTDAFADRAALVLKGSVALTCARSRRPLGLYSKAKYSPCTSPYGVPAPCHALPAAPRSALTGPVATFFMSPICIFSPVAQRLPYFAMLHGSLSLSFESRSPSLLAAKQCVTGSLRISSSCTQQMLL